MPEYVIRALDVAAGRHVLLKAKRTKAMLCRDRIRPTRGKNGARFEQVWILLQQTVNLVGFACPKKRLCVNYVSLQSAQNQLLLPRYLSRLHIANVSSHPWRRDSSYDIVDIFDIRRVSLEERN